MSRHWEAPRLAYELAADWAEKSRLCADGTVSLMPVGGVEVPAGIGKQWHDLRTLEQHDVLEALGAQVRAALWEARRHLGFADDDSFVIEMGYYVLKMCEQSREVLAALTDSSGSRPWKMPECSHCAALVAEALIGVHVGAIMLTGVPDAAAVLRSLAGRATVPVQRKDGDD